MVQRMTQRATPLSSPPRPLGRAVAAVQPWTAPQKARSVDTDRIRRMRRRDSLAASAGSAERPYGIAVVIPCYNGARHLDAAITSALQQSYPVSTVIVADDGSSDESVAIAESYRERGYPVECLKLARNGGPATARNAAIAHVREPLVAFLDADDEWASDHCESLVRLLAKHPDADLAFACTRSTDPLTPDSALPIPAGQPMEMLEHLLDDSFIPQSAVIARRASVVAVGGYSDGLRYGEDYDLWLRMAHGRRFIASGAPSCIRRSHPGQASRDDVKLDRGAWEARARYYEFARRNGIIVPPERYRAICTRAYERDLGSAWQSRSYARLRCALRLATLAPGGEPVRRRWAWRATFVWPLWRAAAFGWDALPRSWRQSLNRVRKNGIGHLTPVAATQMEAAAI